MTTASNVTLPTLPPAIRKLGVPSANVNTPADWPSLTVSKDGVTMSLHITPNDLVSTFEAQLRMRVTAWFKSNAVKTMTLEAELEMLGAQLVEAVRQQVINAANNDPEAPGENEIAAILRNAKLMLRRRGGYDDYSGINTLSRLYFIGTPEQFDRVMNESVIEPRTGKYEEIDMTAENLPDTQAKPGEDLLLYSVVAIVDNPEDVKRAYPLCVSPPVAWTVAAKNEHVITAQERLRAIKKELEQTKKIDDAKTAVAVIVSDMCARMSLTVTSWLISWASEPAALLRVRALISQEVDVAMTTIVETLTASDKKS